MIAEASLDVSLYALGIRHDLRPLVLRTALTYLELAGAVRQLTPRYAGYETKLRRPLAEILRELPAASSKFLDALFKVTKKGRTWHAVVPEEAATTLGEPRDRVVRALEYLEQRGWAELRPSDLRHRFVRNDGVDADALVADLVRRFTKREEADIARVEQILSLIEAPDCQSARLALHFGEHLSATCGHCSVCRSGRTQLLPEPALPPLDALVDGAAFAQLRSSHPRALAHPRQAARFLCGLASPALTQAKLGRHALFGSLATRRFAEVLAWCV
jgi:ATP-dependent DNA helicase RecQ